MCEGFGVGRSLVVKTLEEYRDKSLLIYLIINEKVSLLVTFSRLNH